MSWAGPALTAEQEDVLGLIDALGPSLAGGTATAARRALAKAGLWGVAIDEEHGGSGADDRSLAVVVSRIARYDAALAWACVQAHTAARVLARDTRWRDRAAAVAEGSLSVAVIDEADVAISLGDGRVLLDDLRVDVIDGLDLLIILVGDADAVAVGGDDVTSSPAETTGFDRGTAQYASGSTAVAGQARLAAGDNDGLRQLLACGALAVAAGLSEAASEQAAAYAAGRVQFGAPLTAIPSVSSALERQRAAAHESLAMMLAASSASALDALAGAARAQQRAIETCAAALQSHGGYGYLTEYPAERLVRDAVTLRAASRIDAVHARMAARRYQGSGR